ncbi:MAG: MORN repeat protein [Betaproteobacteria bacterium ADurb.Bin341]|nr:MAG: MORN repeat protein [Betaproteobacteria bacterium ADurb.Bin341]
MKRTSFIAALVLLVGTAQAQTGGWIVDQNGCKAWNPKPRPGDSITWSGKCAKGFAEGQGTLKWFKDGRPDGGEYTGAMRSGKQHGKGTYLTGDGWRYEGDYRDGKWHGKGAFVSVDGSGYKGIFVDGKMHGKGTLFYKNGDRYEGDWVADKKHGKGTFFYKNGDRYDGGWVDDKMHGKGTFTWPDGDRHEGEWVNDTKQGFGVRKEGAKVHRGCWNGNHVTPASSPKECTTGSNPAARKVDQTLDSGDRYVGEVLDGKKHGKGTYIWASGNRYEGEWVNDRKHGKGTFTWTDGDRYEGGWVNDTPQGFGVKKEGAKVLRGCWNDDEVTLASSPAECGSPAPATPSATNPNHSEAEEEAKNFVTGVASWRLATINCRWTSEMIRYLNKIEPEMYAYMVSKGHPQQRLDSYKNLGKEIAERAFKKDPEAFCSDMTKRFVDVQKDAEPNTSSSSQQSQPQCPSGRASDGRCLGAAPLESGPSWLQNLRAEMARCQTKNAISKAICINKAKTRYCPANAYDVKECENLQPNPTVGG